MNSAGIREISPENTSDLLRKRFMKKKFLKAGMIE